MAGEELQEQLVDEGFGRWGADGERGHAMVVTEDGEPFGHGAIGKDGGLEGVRIRVADADGILPRSTPAEGLKDVGDCLDAWQGQAGPVAFIGGAGEHPRASGLAEREGVFDVAGAVDVEADFLGAEGLAGGCEERVHDLFGLKAARSWRGEEGAGCFQLRIGGALIGVGVENELGEVLEIVA